MLQTKLTYNLSEGCKRDYNNHNLFFNFIRSYRTLPKRLIIVKKQIHFEGETLWGCLLLEEWKSRKNSHFYYSELYGH